MGVLTVFSALGLARFGYTMILPPMQEALGLTHTEAGALATGNFVGYLCLALIGGGLAARFSPRRVITVSLLFAGATMILTATAQGSLGALAWRTLTGMGSGGSNVPVMALLAAWFTRSRRGLAIGIAVSGSSFGLILTGPLVPYLLEIGGDANGWRLSWVVLGGIVVGVAGLGWLVLRDRPETGGLRAVGWTEGDLEAGGKSKSAPSAKPLTFWTSWGQVYRTGAVWHLALIYTTFGFSYIIFVTFFARYLQGELEYTKEAAGGLWQVIGWLSISCGVIWGWVSDVLGRKYGLALVCFLQGLTYLLFGLWHTNAGVWVCVVLFGITAWSIPAIMAAACGDHLGSRLAPAALGFVTLFFGIGQALGPWVAGAIADAAGTFSPAMVCAAAVAGVGGVASLLLHRAH
jgi:sugar phosphate permease